MTECPICLTLIGPLSLRQTFCSHVFHKRCLEEWFETSDTCPVCRSPARIITPFPVPSAMTQILASLKIKHAGFADTDPYNAAISELAMDSSINAVRLTTISSGSFQGDYISDIEIFNGELNLDGYYPKSWLKCAAPYANYKLMGGPELRVKYDLYVFQSRTRLAILDIVNKACLFDGSMIYMGINLYLTHFTEEQLVKMSASDLDAILR